MSQLKATLVRKMPCLLGEGSIWHPSDERLWFVDIEGKRFFILDPVTGAIRETLTQHRVGTIVPSQNGHAITAQEDGVYRHDLKSGEVSLLAAHEGANDQIRFNDGKCDPSGRLWVGSMHLEAIPEKGALYCLTDNELKKVISGVTISNGLCWSLDHKTMYYIDSPRQKVVAFDFDNDLAEITNERVVVSVDKALGTPDGMTIDEEGKLWVALWGGAAVGRWDPVTGELLQRVVVPALNVTSCAFGGSDWATLYITSASIDMTEEEHSKYPDAGSLFSVRPGVSGVPAYLFQD
ncbi:MAG: SMP-30/gluconolactonase/LRE family protein [Bacteroidota bacterium]